MIFFDLDDTLLDHESAARAGAKAFYEAYRFAFSEDEENFQQRWNTVSEKYFQANNIAQYSFLEARRLRVRELFSDPLTDVEAEARFDIYLKIYELNWKLYADAMPCLLALQGHKLGLITNGESETARLKIKKLGLDSCFWTVIISREVNCAKPDKAIFELAAKQAGVNISDCVYVGDRLETDALSSHRAGMKGIWLDRKGKGIGKEFDVPVIKSLMELPKLLR